MSEDILHIFDAFSDGINKESLGSRFSQGTLCIYCDDGNEYYEISVEKVFELMHNDKIIELTDFKRII